ncbi:L-glyceraldehyde 3-phosphate reductase [compost metagenome]
MTKLIQVAAARGQSLAQMALVWALRGGRLTSALIGASRVSQIEENVAALSNPDFTQEELDLIEDILK